MACSGYVVASDPVGRCAWVPISDDDPQQSQRAAHQLLTNIPQLIAAQVEMEEWRRDGHLIERHTVVENLDEWKDERDGVQCF